MTGSDHTIGARYADLLDDENDPADIRLLHYLETGYTSVAVPPALQRHPSGPTVRHAARRAGLAGAGRPGRWRIHTKLYAALVVAIAAVIVAATSVTMAGSRQDSITDLGPPTNARPQFPPIGGFRRIKTTLTSHGLPELLFIGTLVDLRSAGERWAVVKALNQFGTLSDVSPVVIRSCSYQNGSQAPQVCEPAEIRGYVTGVSTFDWSHAVYHSKYLVFMHKDLIDQNLQMRQTLTPLERSLFTRYVAETGFSNWHDTVWHTAIDEYSGLASDPAHHRFPLVVISRYLQTDAEVAIYGDLSDVAGRLMLPFAAVQQSLQKGRAQGTASPSLITDYNAEANLLTAFICHADGLKPAQVCHRSVIRSILKHIH